MRRINMSLGAGRGCREVAPREIARRRAGWKTRISRRIEHAMSGVTSRLTRRYDFACILKAIILAAADRD